MSPQAMMQWRLFWIFIRDKGTCAVCGRGVNAEDAATHRPIPGSSTIGDLDEIRLVHSSCKD